MLNLGYLKRLILLLLLSVFLCNSAYSQETQDPTQENTSVDEASEVFLNLASPQEEYNLTLEEAMNVAMENNSKFNIQKEQSKIFKIRAQQSALDFLPILNTTMQWDYQSNIAKIGQDDVIDIPFVGPVTFGGFLYDEKWKRYNSVVASQPITGLYRIYHWRRIAALSFDKAMLEEELAADNLALSVYYYYFNVLHSKYQLEADEQNVQELESYHKTAFARYEEGSSIKRDAQKVQVELDNARYKVFVSQNELKNKTNKMKNILGIPQNSSLTVNPSFENLSNSLPESEAIQVALENNQKIKQYEIDIKIAQHSKKEQFGRYIPDFNVNATYFNQSGMEYMPKNDFMLSFNMDFKFFDWGKRELSIKEKQHEINQANLNLKDYLENLEIDIKEKYSKVEEAEMLTEVSKKAVELAKKNVEISSLRYQTGLQLITDVLSDQSQLSKARANYYQALFNEQIAIAELKKAMGVLLKIDSSD